MLVGENVNWNGRKLLTVNDNTTENEGLEIFLNLRRKLC